MFSFFRKGKKEPERKGRAEAAPTAADASVAHLGDAPTSAVTPLEKNDSTAMSAPPSAPLSYAGIMKRPDVAPPRAVKPCGHATTAVAPSAPLAGKRENVATPPASPKFELKRTAKVAPLERQVSSGDGGKLRPSPSAEALVQSLGGSPMVNGTDSEGKKKNLINQEAKFQSQLNDLSKQLSVRDAEANKLRFQMEELQRDVFAKSAGMDRLEAELQAAHKECEIIRQRVRHLESELADSRRKNADLSTDITGKSETFTSYETQTNAKIAELEGIIKNLQLKIESLETELETLKQQKQQLEEQRTVILAEREQDKKRVEEILQQATVQKQEVEQKWKADFEKHRTINIMKEQQLLDDFEWKLREVQQACKQRLEEKDKSIAEKLQAAYQEAEKKMKEAENMMAQVETLKSYEIEIQQLKGVTVDQEKALKDMTDQQAQMKAAEEGLKSETKRLRNMIEMEKENLQHMQRKHNEEISYKERTLQQTLRQKRTEIAMYWEERLLHECARLKSELEQIHIEEKHFAMETVRREKEEEFDRAQEEWDRKMKECLKEIATMKMALEAKDEFYHDEIVRTQTNTDRDLLDLRRLMDKIDMTHHDRFEKLVQEHEMELERINEDAEQKLKDVEMNWQQQVTSLRHQLEQVKEQMEKESQQKVESLIAQHRTDLDAQWANLISQKSEAVQLVEEEYVSKYKALEEQVVTQQKSHENREIELLKAIDSMKNELNSKDSSLDDLQNNVDTLEGGIQVLNQEIAQQNDHKLKSRRESDQKIRGLQETITALQEQQEKERESFRLKLMEVHKQNQTNMDHLQRKCTCLTKLFEEVRLRYERRESRPEDLTIISDLRQVIAEQEKDLACLNEEKRYFQMRLLSVEENVNSGDDDAFEDAEQARNELPGPPAYPPSGLPPAYPLYSAGPMLSIPPTIHECDE